MTTYGVFGGPNKVIEAYIEWRDDRLAKIEEGLLQEADSKADFPEFLYGPIRTALWHGYEAINPQYRRYARIENAPDFRERRLRGINALRGVGYVGDHGEYPGMYRTERPSAALVVDTYGGVYAITRQAIRNDDTGQLLNRNPQDMGSDIGNFVAETLVALIESNPTAPDGQPFYSVGRGNQTTAALSEDSLADALTFMRQQRDDDNRRIRVQVATLLVQGGRPELVARRILNSAETGVNVQYTGGTAGIGTGFMDKGTMNPLRGILGADAVVVEPFFSDPNDWYLFADPDNVPAFVLGFLDGIETPFIGLKDPTVRNALGPGMDPYTYELDSIDFKVRHDFGAASFDPRGTFRGVVA